tara:strand:- start:34192 stop:35406 length:1215 start_codon:yes stop_codon:yes gene_type:complete
MSLKVLHLFDHSIPLQSGYTFRSRAIMLHQMKMGYQVKALTSERHGRSSSEQEVIDDITFYRVEDKKNILKSVPLLNQYYTVYTLRQRLKEVLKKWQPDIIHSHSPLLTAWAALPVAKKFSIPLVYEIRAFWEDAAVDHGTHQHDSLRYKLIKALETKISLAATSVTTICEGLKLDLISRGIPAEKITVIPNAVDLSQFSHIALGMAQDESILEKYDLKNKFIIGFIGSLYSYEGLDTLIKAFPEVKKNIPNAKLLIVGGGPQFQFWKALKENSICREDIIFTGRVPHEQVQKFYQLLNVLVYPRKKLRLTDLVTPLKPLEAMAMGKCVIASDVGGHKELIENGSNGLLFEAESIDDLTLKILTSQNKETRENLIEKGRRYVESERNWPNSVAKYQAVYSDCLK